MPTRSVYSLVLAALVAIAAMPVSAATTMQEHRVTSPDDSSIEIYVRERLPENTAPDAKNGQAVLFVHGATYPGITFDTPLADGESWMARMAEAGYKTYYMDQRGYGESARPAAMAEPASDNPPFARAADVLPDMDAVVEFIRERTGDDRIDLVGWSWGTVTTGMYTAAHNDKIDRLVLYAPVYQYENQAWTSKLADPDNGDRLADVGAYRTVNREQADARWADQIDADPVTEWRSDAVFTRWFDAMLAMEPGESAEQVKAPNGVLVDLWEIFNGRAIYEASKITVPTLVIRGDDDPTATDADARGLYGQLGAATKRYVVVGDATHFLCLEKNAPQLFAETQLFLDEQ